MRTIRLSSEVVVQRCPVLPSFPAAASGDRSASQLLTFVQHRSRPGDQKAAEFQSNPVSGFHQTDAGTEVKRERLSLGAEKKGFV
ncbi:hypothetical protein TNCV_2030901 [Trichonephila clavipes]|nr:hypothetical protein TNCV_2030901 [Trichonephila clavipes]